MPLRSGGMRTSKNRKSKAPKNPEPQSPETTTHVETPVESATTKAGKATTRPGKRILSVAIPEKLARQVRLLCNVEGTSAQQLVESALKRAVAKRLPDALAAISKTDADE